MNIATTRFDSVHATTPHQWCTTWDELCTALFDHPERARKADGALWSPVSYRRGSRRRNANVDQVTCAVIDIDDGTPLEVATEALHGVAWLAYTTWSHTGTSPRYHLVIPFEHPVPAPEWPAVHRSLRAWLGCGDALPDPARMYYLPQHSPLDEDWWVERSPGAALRITPRRVAAAA